jgi:hypothetical protein
MSVVNKPIDCKVLQTEIANPLNKSERLLTAIANSPITQKDNQ